MRTRDVVAMPLQMNKRGAKPSDAELRMHPPESPLMKRINRLRDPHSPENPDVPFEAASTYRSLVSALKRSPTAGHRAILRTIQSPEFNDSLVRMGDTLARDYLLRVREHASRDARIIGPDVFLALSEMGCAVGCGYLATAFPQRRPLDELNPHPPSKLFSRAFLQGLADSPREDALASLALARRENEAFFEANMPLAVPITQQWAALDAPAMRQGVESNRSPWNAQGGFAGAALHALGVLLTPPWKALELGAKALVTGVKLAAGVTFAVGAVAGGLWSGAWAVTEWCGFAVSMVGIAALLTLGSVVAANGGGTLIGLAAGAAAGVVLAGAAVVLAGKALSALSHRDEE